MQPALWHRKMSGAGIGKLEWEKGAPYKYGMGPPEGC